ncbi:40464_t:CDS:2, partial [Gigaspora margarita]
LNLQRQKPQQTDDDFSKESTQVELMASKKKVKFKKSIQVELMASGKKVKL